METTMDNTTPRPPPVSQQFIATIPSECQGPWRIPICTHKSGLKYIPLSTIRELFPHMKRLEIGGKVLEKRVGFKSLGDDEDMEGVQEGVHKRQDEGGNEKAEWIPYYRNQVIHVIHDHSVLDGFPESYWNRIDDLMGENLGYFPKAYWTQMGNLVREVVLEHHQRVVKRLDLTVDDAHDEHDDHDDHEDHDTHNDHPSERGRSRTRSFAKPPSDPWLPENPKSSDRPDTNGSSRMISHPRNPNNRPRSPGDHSKAPSHYDADYHSRESPRQSMSPRPNESSGRSYLIGRSRSPRSPDRSVGAARPETNNHSRRPHSRSRPLALLGDPQRSPSRSGSQNRDMYMDEPHRSQEYKRYRDHSSNDHHSDPSYPVHYPSQPNYQSRNKRQRHLSAGPLPSSGFEFSNEHFKEFLRTHNGSVESYPSSYSYSAIKVTLTLRSAQEARSFCRFLQARDFPGTWIDLTLAWVANHHQMNDYVKAIRNAPAIEIVHIACARGIAPRYFRGSCDAWVELLGIPTIKELQLIEAPKILRLSSTDVPSDLSHLRLLRLGLDIEDFSDHSRSEKIQNIIHRATHLQRLILDSPRRQFRRQLERILGAHPFPGQIGSPSTDIQFNNRGKATIVLKVERASAEVKELLLERDRVRPRDCPVSWSSLFQGDLLKSLTTLRLRHTSDSEWIHDIIDWAKKSRHLQKLHVDCKKIRSESFGHFCEMLRRFGPTLRTLELENFFPTETDMTLEDMISIKKEMGDREEGEWTGLRTPSETDWHKFLKSLNFRILRILEINKSNMADVDLQMFVDCMENSVGQGQRPALEALRLYGTQIGGSGIRLPIEARERNAWPDFITDIANRK